MSDLEDLPRSGSATLRQCGPDPFEELKARLAERGLAPAEAEALEAYKSHHDFEVEIQRFPNGELRIHEPTSCEGMLRIDAREGPKLFLICDVCGEEWSTRLPTTELTDYLLEQAGLPELFAGREFDKTLPGQQDALKTCREWMRGYKSNPLPAVALWGGTGRGKSHLLSLMIETVVRNYNVEAPYRSMIALMNELRDAIGAGTFDRTYSRLLNVPLLALDDLGAGRMTDAGRDWLAGLIDHRYTKERPLLVSTNVPPQRWAEAFGDRAASRLRGMVIPLRIEGPDRRAQGVQEQLVGADS
jgi:DNA replication protein DnaC